MILYLRILMYNTKGKTKEVYIPVTEFRMDHQELNIHINGKIIIEYAYQI